MTLPVRGKIPSVLAVHAKEPVLNTQSEHDRLVDYGI